jgi:predicted DsbA family dithiol-disulfide isomerase
MSKAMNITIDVTSDAICPWCWIGKRRLEKAITLAGREDVRVRWHPFQLNPHMPKEGMNRREYRTAKFGSWERSLALDAQMRATGHAEGISFDFERNTRTPNTLDAHRLIWLADQEGSQHAVVEAIFRAYFTDGRDIGDRQTLLDVAAGAGLARRSAEAVLNGDDGMEAIRAAEDQARRIGVRGVPLFLINNSVALAGAMEPSAFLDAFHRADVAAPTPHEAKVCNLGSGREPAC